MYEVASIDGLPAGNVKVGDKEEITTMKDPQLYSWIREEDVPPGKSILLTKWARRMKARPLKRQEKERWILHGAMDGMRTSNQDFTEFLAGVLTECLGLYMWKTGTMSFVHESNETRVVSHVDDPFTCAKPVTLDRFWIHVAKLAVNKRSKALNPRVTVVYLGLEFFCVDECLDLVQLQNAKPVVTPLNRRVRIYTKKQTRYQVQHALARVVVGKLQYIAGVGRDLLFVTMFVIQTSVANTCRCDTR